jgi:Holliday junction resolvase RusA-like endonuclease
VTGAVPAGGGLPVAVSRVVLSIPEVPVPKKRPQLTWRRGAEHAYTPAATLLAEKRIRGHARGQLGERWPPLVGPVRLSVTAYLPMPRDIPKRLQATAFPVRRPDLDNCLKLIMDALTPGRDPWGVWGDDSQVVAIDARKDYARGRPPGWEVVIEPLNHQPAEAGAPPDDLGVKTSAGWDDGGSPGSRVG